MVGSRRAATAIIGLALASAAGCGASYTNLYEADVRFEHCYRLDEDPNVAVAQKRACWRDWSRYHTYGQTRDRVEYAVSRARALSEPGAAAASMSGPTSSGKIACPMPSNAFVPPPQMLPPPPPPAPAASEAVPGATPANAPGATCSASCGRSWEKCGTKCDTASCKVHCDEKYRACMRGCY